MVVVRYAVAVVLVLVGLIWIGQGIGMVPGSFMSGQRAWAGIGAVCVVVGAYLAWSTRRSSSR